MPDVADLVTSQYAYDFEACEKIGRQLAIILASGNWDAAFRSLRTSIEKELVGDGPTAIEEMAIAELPGLSVRTINGLEEKMGAIFLRDLRGVTPSDIRSYPDFGGGAVRELIGAIESLGLPFPIPESYVFKAIESPIPDLPHFPSQEKPMENKPSLVDAITSATKEDIAAIDAEIVSCCVFYRPGVQDLPHAAEGAV